MSAWRMIRTYGESLKGIAPVCPQQSEPMGPHDLDPGKPNPEVRYDMAGVYDCCPGPHLECNRDWTAARAAEALTEADAEACP